VLCFVLLTCKPVTLDIGRSRPMTRMDPCGVHCLGNGCSEGVLVEAEEEAAASSESALGLLTFPPVKQMGREWNDLMNIYAFELCESTSSQSPSPSGTGSN
jgi:hypothetical protein